MEIPRRTFLGLAGAALGFGGAAAVWYGLLRNREPAAVPTTRGVPPATSSDSTTTAAIGTTAAAPASSTTAPAITTTTTTTTTAPPPTTAPAGTVAAGAAVIVGAVCVDAWGGRPMAFTPDEHAISRLMLHHTASVLGDNRRAPARARQHQRFHQDSGWADIAYHYLVDRNGHVLAGRDPAFAGDTFTEYDPRGYFLVVAEGNFDVEEPTPAQVRAVADLFAWASGHYGAGLETLVGHRDAAATSCPGDNLYVRLDEIRRLAEDRLAAGGVALEALCGPEAEALVAAIEAGSDEPAYSN